MKNKRLFLSAAAILSFLFLISCKEKTKIIDVKLPEPIAEVRDYATDTNIGHGTREFLKVLNSGGKPLESMTPEEARLVLVGAQASANVDYSGIEESEKTITENGLTVKLNIVRPKGITGKTPAFIFVHGGGWVLGDYPTHRRLVRDLVVLSGATAVFVEYTRSPEAKYPVALDEVYAAAKWVSKNGAEINVDGSKLGIVGNSAGGNLAAGTALLAKEKGKSLFKFVNLLWPVADTSFETESFKKFATHRFLTAPTMKWMFDNYTTRPEDRKDYHIALVNASSEELKDFPPTLIQVAENDILRDEGETFGRHLDEAGIEVATVRYNGTIHDFGLLNALATQTSTRSMLEHAATEIKKHLK
ncbi:alpha/beta hydrolase [Flavobacterium hauense]